MGQIAPVCPCSTGIPRDRSRPAVGFPANMQHPFVLPRERNTNDVQNEASDDPTDPTLWLVPFWSPREAPPSTLPLPSVGFAVPPKSSTVHKQASSSEDGAASTATPPPVFKASSSSGTASPRSPASARDSPVKANNGTGVMPGLGFPHMAPHLRTFDAQMRSRDPATLGRVTNQSRNSKNAGRISTENAIVEPEKLNDPLDPSLFNTPNSCASNTIPFTADEYEEMTKQQRYETRQVVRDFVKMMVRGRTFTVVSASGELRKCFCVLSRQLDRLKISLSEKDKRVREIRLGAIEQIMSGVCLASNLLVTLQLEGHQSITFEFLSTEDRQKFEACLSFLCNEAKGRHTMS